MSLLVWLPMTKDLSDQGLGGCTITNEGATLDNNGKLGKCYNFDGTNDRIKVSGLNNPKNITIAFWMKRNATTNTRQFLFTAWNGVSIELSAANNLFGKVQTSSGEAGGASGGTVTADSGWIHVCYTFEDKVGGKMYINGVLINSGNTTSSIAWNVTSGYIGNYSNIYLNAKMNDFRIYDHALSPKEIEILSRGLVCHYPLNNNGGGQPNLYDFESDANKWVGDGLTRVNYIDSTYGNVIKATAPSTLSSLSRIYRVVSNVWTAGQTYTVSFLARASKTITVKASRSTGDFAPDFTVGTEWKRYVGIINCTTTAAGGTLSIQNITVSSDLYITQIKLELGDKATAYCPGVGDSHYIPLGYDSTTEYDVSGYGNNGTFSANPTYSTNSARYSVSTYFGVYQTPYMTLNSTSLLPTLTNCSISWWQYCTNSGNTLVFSGDGTHYIAAGTTSTKLYDRKVGSSGIKMYKDGVEVNTIYDTNNVVRHETYYEVNKWHHYVLTGINLSSWSQFCINSYSDSFPLRSYLSDFRLYATALSAEQVAELYNTAVSVANNGTLMGYELVEV